MEQSVQKFIEYLEWFSDRIMFRTFGVIGECMAASKLNNSGRINPTTFMNSVKQYTSDNDINVLYEAIQKWIEYFKNENSKEENKFFVQFSQLSAMLEISSLSVRDSLNIVLFIIKRNLKEGILEVEGLKNTILLGYDEDSLIIDDFNKGNLISLYLAFEVAEGNLSVLTTENIKTIREFVRKCEKNFQSIRNVHKIFDKHYIKKENEFEIEDIKPILDAFALLKFSEEQRKAFHQFLLKKAKKSEKQKNVEKFTSSAPKTEIKKISQKEYNQIFREIESYYDIQNQKVIRPLSLQEIVYLVSLLFKIQISEKEIEKCIKNINKEGLNAYNNPLSQFNDYYNKMITLTNNPEVKESIHYIKECMQTLYIPESDNDYAFWKQEIATELIKILKIVNKDCKYEIEEGRRFRK